jgi:hypothetical protein
MMLYLFFLSKMLFILFLIVKIQANNCDDRTSYYTNGFNVNKNYHYFDPTTYTESTQSMTVQEYKNYIKKSVCTGEWCYDDKWGCKLGDSKNCYNVEHIIPKVNTIAELNGCSVDIQGNFIMAYGAWNQALKNEYYGEKTIIYGSSRMMTAYHSVYYACYNKIPITYPAELCLSATTGIHYFLIICFILSLSTVFLVIYIVYLQTYKIEDSVETKI